MVHTIAKLIKIIEEMDIQIPAHMNKIEAQNVVESSQRLAHPQGFTLQSDTPQASMSMQVKRQTTKPTLVATLCSTATRHDNQH